MTLPIDMLMAGKVLLSFVVGAVIGFEREMHESPAGVRTYAAVSMGACVFAIASYYPFLMGFHNAADPTRIAAQVASGIGFIGAGVIFKEGLNTVGLTTAATLWSTAALGVAIAFDLYFVALLSAGLTLGLLALSRWSVYRVLISFLRKKRPKADIRREGGAG